MSETKRKGSRTIKDIPPNILSQLNNGQIETANLVEWLAIDQQLLLENLLKQLQRTAYMSPVLTAVGELKKTTITTVSDAIGAGLFTQATRHNDLELLKIMANHPSDTVRCWATHSVGKNDKLTLFEMLQQIQPFAADTHFGVREIAWMAVRPKMAKNLTETIEILARWTTNTDENVRRFASESTRPRGVWCAHIEILKQNPALALPILEPLKADKSKYVQDSVGNWLNDASKTQPDFVYQICAKWEKESTCKETTYIINKALRTLEKR